MTSLVPAKDIRPRRRWYAFAVVLLVAGVAAGIGLLAVAASARSAGGAVAALVGAVACPGGALLVAAVVCLLVALRRHAAHTRSTPSAEPSAEETPEVNRSAE